MAEVEGAGDFADKSKPINEVLHEEDDAEPKKKLKTEVTLEENGSAALPAAEKVAECDEQLAVAAAAEEEHAEDDEDEEDYNAEQDEDEDEDVNGEAENVDEKGKGVLVDRKGKGKMIEEPEDDDSDGSDDESSDDSDSDFSDGLDDSDLEDDPLAEVDLDNILPSRTRTGQVQPGFRIFSDQDKGKDA